LITKKQSGEALEEDQLFHQIQENKVEKFVEESKKIVCMRKRKRTIRKNKDQNKIDIGFILLDMIKSYPFDLFKIRLLHLVKIIIKEDVEKFARYLDSRALTPDYLSGVNIGKVENNQVFIFTEDKLWQTNEIYLKKKAKYNKEPTGPIQLKILDMTGLHVIDTMDNIKDNLEVLYDKLEDEETNMIFQHGVIKALIEVKWPYIMRRIMVWQLLPYTMFMIFLLVYTIKDWNTYESLVNDPESENAS